MKKIKIVLILASLCLAIPSASVLAYDDSLDKDTIVSELWSDWWVGKGDDGKTFPEASYKHHILEEWVESNYGSDDYEWADTGELHYSFQRYYQDLIENWDFNDDNNGNWTIDTCTTTYHFSLDNGKWLMIDGNGNTVDTFVPFSTLEEVSLTSTKGQNNSSRRVKEGGLPQESPVRASSTLGQETTTINVENRTESSEDVPSGILYALGTLILAGIATIIITLSKRRKNTTEE